jgi:hypothetical protein
MTGRIVLSILVSLVVLGSVATADKKIEVERPNPAFAGRVILSDKRFPTQAKSLAAYNAQVKKQAKENFYEDKEKKSWRIYFAGFLRGPLNDVEYVVKVFELVGNRGGQMLAAVDQIAYSRGSVSLMSDITLPRSSVGVNKQLLIRLETKQNKVLAEGRFKILGEGERHSGKVNFSEEDANGKKTDDD